jgi:hypothetical protein
MSEAVQTDRATVRVVYAARLLLLAEAAGMGLTLVHWVGWLIWFIPLGWAAGIGIPVFFGIPAVFVALRANLVRPRLRIIWFLAANTCCGLFLAIVGFLQPNPEPHLVVTGGATISAGLLVLVAVRAIDSDSKRSALVTVTVAMVYLSSYALPPTLPVAAVLHLEGVLTVPPNTNGWKNLTGPDGGDRRQGLSALTRTFTVNPGSYRVDLGCPGYFDQSVSKIVQVGIGASVEVPADCPPPPNISASTGKCGPFPNPLEPLDTGFNTLIGPPIGVEAFGCGPGLVPANDTPFLVEAGWTASFSYSCNGTFGPTGNRPVIQLTAHDTITGTDQPSEAFDGIAGLGGFGGVTSSNRLPAGRYVIRVTLPYPDDNQCQWHLIVHRAR